MVLHFGDWVLDGDARVLRRGDQPVHPRAKTFDLLLALVFERPKAISKSDLLERLWPGTYVQEANLSNAIGELRRTLGDRGSTPRFIRTVHTFGYAFIAAVAEDGALKTGPQHLEITATERLLCGPTVIGLAGREAIVGRDESADVVFAEPSVSRRHARLALNGDGRRIVEDLGSQNGTWVNERRVIDYTALADRDRIRFGRVLVTYRNVGSAFTTEKLPAE